MICFGIEHNCMAKPFIVLIKIPFKEKNDSEFFDIQVARLLFKHDIEASVPLFEQVPHSKAKIG